MKLKKKLPPTSVVREYARLEALVNQRKAIEERQKVLIAKKSALKSKIRKIQKLIQSQVESLSGEVTKEKTRKQVKVLAPVASAMAVAAVPVMPKAVSPQTHKPKTNVVNKEVKGDARPVVDSAPLQASPSLPPSVFNDDDETVTIGEG